MIRLPISDRLPSGIHFSVIHEFCCTQGSVPVSYVGSTMRYHSDRVSEHADNKSVRTGKMISSRLQSSIFDHFAVCKCSVNLPNFKILSSVPSKKDFDLRIIESLHILKKTVQILTIRLLLSRLL